MMDERTPPEDAGGAAPPRIATVLEARLLMLVEERLGLEPCRATLASTFTTDLGADSLDKIELSLAIEEAFGITISDDEAEALVTVQDALTLVQSKSGP